MASGREGDGVERSEPTPERELQAPPRDPRERHRRHMALGPDRRCQDRKKSRVERVHDDRADLGMARRHLARNRPAHREAEHAERQAWLRARRVRIACTGVVVRVEPVVSDHQRSGYNTAIYFTDISDHDRSAISHFVGQRLSGNA